MLKLHLHLNQETGEQAFVAAVFIYFAEYAFLTSVNILDKAGRTEK